MLGVRLDTETEQSLADLAKQMRRSKSDIVRDAITHYVRSRHAAVVAEAHRQSAHAVERGRTEHDDFWESIAAADDDGEASQPYRA